jgi:energy-coupling factor transporter ATP-binding protein EcfA2
MVSASTVSTLPNGTVPGNIFLDGPNFSGRSELLKRATGLIGSPQQTNVTRGAYVGPEVHNAISGLAQTVAHELELNGTSQCPEIASLVRSSSLAELQSRNPFTLSGGEQALLAIATAIVSGRDACGIDCAAEQLDERNRRLLFEWMRTHPPRSHGVRMIADNRMEESCFTEHISLSPCGSPGPLIDAARFQIPEVKPHVLGMRNVSFRYKGSPDWIFQHCSVELESGKTYILRGPNGSGKSTWAKLLTGVLRASEGAITDNGTVADVWRYPGRLVGYHFQNPDLQLFSKSVCEEVKQGSRLSGEMCDKTAVAFGLTDILSSHPLDLPFVLRKRVGLASTVATGRPWLIFDEPVLGQDLKAAEAIATLLKSLVWAGTGLIIISHHGWFDSLFEAIHLSINAGQVMVRRDV